MAYLLDYSARQLDGQTVKNAGYAGAIRYIDTPKKMGQKHTTPIEYHGLINAGLTVYLVIERAISDPDSGFAGGQAMARDARAGADFVGYPANMPIFFCNDRTTVASASLWRGYLDGAASILGVSKVGAYGFANAIDIAQGHAAYFWQSGRRSDVRNSTNFWQDNNTQVQVGGITCDRNLILKPISLLEENMPLNATDIDMIVDAVRYRVMADASGFGFNGRNLVDTWLQTMNDGIASRQEHAALQAAVNSLADAVAHQSGVSPESLKAAVVEAIQENLVHVSVDINQA